MRGRTARIRTSAHAEAARWKLSHDALLDVLNAVLLAHGQAPDGRLAVAHVYYKGRQRHPVIVESIDDRIVIRLDMGADVLAAPPKVSRFERIVRTVRRWLYG